MTWRALGVPASLVLLGGLGGAAAVVLAGEGPAGDRGAVGTWGAAAGLGVAIVLAAVALVRAGRTRPPGPAGGGTDAFERQLSDVAHDLRTPLAALQLAIEEASALAPSGEAADLLVTALREAQCMALLIENLRVAARLEQGAVPPPSAVDLAAAVEACVSRARPIARRLGVSLEVGMPERAVGVECPELLVLQALTNLVLVAIFRGQRGGHVAVLVHPVAAGFRLTVTDDGPGMPPGPLPSLRDRRAFVDPRCTGAGLALAVTAEAIRRQGWSLSFHANDLQGVRAVIEGPLAAREGPEPAGREVGT